VQAPIGVDASRATLRLDGDRQGVMVDFAHASHQERMGGEASCTACHHVSAPNDRATTCARCHQHMLVATDIFSHADHVSKVAAAEGLSGPHPGNRACGECHAEALPKSAETASSCFSCHKDDMWLGGVPDPDLALETAGSYQDAMHRLCIGCHKEQAAVVGQPDLPECATCHESMKKAEPGLRVATLGGE